MKPHNTNTYKPATKHPSALNIPHVSRAAVISHAARKLLLQIPPSENSLIHKTPYRDSVDGTRDRVTYQKLVTRSRYGLIHCAVGIWPSHQRDDTVTA